MGASVSTLRGLALLTRWVLLFGLAIFIGVDLSAFLILPLVLLAAGVWNLALSVRWLFGRRWRRQELIEVIVDFACAAALFYLSRTLVGAWVWAGLLPVAAAAWGFGLSGGVLGAVATAIGFAALAIIDVPIAEIPFLMVLPSLAFLAAGALLGFASRQLALNEKQSGDLELSRSEESKRRERERIKAVYEITGTLNSSLIFDRVLEMALDLGISAFTEPDEPVSRAIGGILLFSEGGLRLVAGRRLAASDIGRVLPGREGALAELLKDVEARVIAEPGKDAEFSHISGLQSAQSLYALPLVLGVDLFGLMFFAHPEADFFTAERRELVDVVARQVMVALQNAQLYEALNEEKERIVHIQEQARKQLARNLHDGPTQSVAAIAMRTNLARRLLAKDPNAAGEELYRLEDLARRSTKEIRHMLFTLRPQSLETGGLGAALNDLAAQVQDSYEIALRVEMEADALARVDLGRQNVLFYIAAEAIANARKHANAKLILVKLSKSEHDVLALEVRDDGQGFTPQEEQEKHETDGTLGLDTLRERVELINGVMRLDSVKGRGTQLRVWVPLSEAAGERLRRGEP